MSRDCFLSYFDVISHSYHSKHDCLDQGEGAKKDEVDRNPPVLINVYSPG